MHLVLEILGYSNSTYLTLHDITYFHNCKHKLLSILSNLVLQTNTISGLAKYAIVRGKDRIQSTIIDHVTPCAWPCLTQREVPWKFHVDIFIISVSRKLVLCGVFEGYLGFFTGGIVIPEFLDELGRPRRSCPEGFVS